MREGEERSGRRNVEWRPENVGQSRGTRVMEDGREHTGSVPCREGRARVVAKFPRVGLMRCPGAGEPDHGRETVVSG